VIGIDYFEIVRLAVRNLQRRKLRAVLTMIGIVFGITAIISLVSLAQGLQDSIGNQFGNLGADNVIITQKGLRGPPIGSKALTLKDFDLVEGLSDFDLVVPVNMNMGTVEYNKEELDFFVRSVPGDRFDDWAVLRNWEFLQGRNIGPTSRGEVIIGQAFAEEQFDKRIYLNSKITIKGKDFKVVGIIKNTGSQADDRFVGISRDDAKDIFSVGNTLSLVVGKVKKGVDIDSVVERVKRKLEKARGTEDIEVQTAGQLQAQFKTILGVVSIVVIGIAAISLVVGGIGIANSMFTSVLERTKEIGIMKSIGARNSDILKIFLLEAGLIGLIGGGIGVSLGVLLSLGVKFGASAADIDIAVSIRLWVLLGAMFFSMFIGVASGIIPAIQASKHNPVEALHYE
jgi:putative ABC transport system permease protein